MTPPSISTKRRVAEIIAVILTAGGKFVFMDYLNWRFPFIIVVIICWVAYVLYRAKTTKSILEYWGLRTDNFKTVLRKVLPFGLASVVVFIGLGFYQNTINFTWHIIPILILYPIWGILQQFLLIALTTWNMQDMSEVNISKISIILSSALLFASVHYPFRWLMIATFVLAVFYRIIYLRERNLYVLGIFHGWLGGLFYYTVLDRDPFIETFGKVLHLTN